MKKILLLAATLLLLASCGGKKKADNSWLTSNDVKIAIDETFQPIMAEQLQQFGLSHVQANLLPLYCSEDSAIRLLVDDSLRSIVVTRKLTARELQKIQQAGHSASQSMIASEAFALIINKNNPDSTIRLSEVKKIVSGQITDWSQLRDSKKKGKLSLVFDNSGSSTVRYMRDSLCGGKELKGNLYAQGTNTAVIEAVKENPNAIGVVGTDWLRGKSENVLPNFNSLDVRVMLVTSSDEAYPQFYRPYQYCIAIGQYPLVRSVYAITTDPRERSMPKLLYFWLKGQKGQLIFCNNSQLLPVMPVQIRSVNVN